jgi:GH25 family lysozyme M1 (1,4-beta-N-acetylmuramidase)
MTTARHNWPVMFRAGAAGTSEPPALAAPHAALQAPAGPKVLLADISEFQPDINDAAYLLWSRAIIIRAAYGAQHDDHAWRGGRRRDLLHQGGVRFLGIYQYVTAFEDPARQAAALIELVGALRPGEKLIADIEEGTGDLRDTWRIWSAAVAGATGDEPWLYSGLNFAAAHGLAPVEWVAAYQAAEPLVTHQLWQFTDAFAVPGIGSCDCSVFHGTIDQLAALAYQPAARPATATTEDDMPSGLITSPRGVRESRTWPAGTVRQIVLFSDWEGVQDEPPLVDLRIAHMKSKPFAAGRRTADGTDVYVIGTPDDCNGCSFTRVDAGPATVSFHTNP